MKFITFIFFIFINIDLLASELSLNKNKFELNGEDQLSFILKDSTEKERIDIIIKDLLDYNIQYVPYNDILIPINSYLLLNGYINEAIYLVKNNLTKPFLIFNYNNSELSDLVIAMENNIMKYLDVSIPKTDNINKKFKYNSEKGFTLIMLSSVLKNEYSYRKTEILLRNNADLNMRSFNTYSAMDLAIIEDNKDFILAYNDNFNNTDYKTIKNTPLLDKDVVNQNKILNSIKKEGYLNNASFNDKYKRFNQFIFLGYNILADYIFEDIKNDIKFDINKITENGLNPIIASTLSEVIGGNVDYAQKLIDNGADITVNKDGKSLAEMALYKDNFKIIILLYKENGKVFFDDNGLSLFKKAMLMDNKAIKSAFVIKELSKRIIGLN
jgi:hypothetical protein